MTAQSVPESEPSAPAVVDPAPDAPRRARGIATRDTILRAGLALFAEHGYSPVSMRRICKAADVNLALINYYFGTKAQLLQAIFARWGGRYGGERQQRVRDIVAAYPAGQAPLDELLAAFVRPSLWLSRGQTEEERQFLRFSGRLGTDPTPEVRAAIEQVYDDSALEFSQALRQNCPHLDDQEFLARLEFLYGAMLYTRSEIGRVDSLALRMSLGPARLGVDQTAEYLVHFLAAAFRAPAKALPATGTEPA